jgi:hypothetical protein
MNNEDGVEIVCTKKKIGLKKTKFVQDILRELDDDWTEDDIVGIVCDVSTREKSVYRIAAERIWPGQDLSLMEA